MEQFEKPQLPTMLNGAAMCVDSKAWNTHSLALCLFQQGLCFHSTNFQLSS